MKKLIILFCLLYSICLFGYTKTGMDLAVRGGYREDLINVKSLFDMTNIPSISFYDIKFDKTRSFQTTAFTNLRFFGLNLFGTVNYASIFSCKGSLTWPIMTGIDNFFPKSDLKNIKGHFFDYYATIGYGIELYDSKFIIIPQIGYGEFNQNIKKPTISDEMAIQTNFGIFPATLYYQVDPTKKEFNIKWAGYNFGGDLIFDFKNFFQFEMGYFFYYLTYDFTDGFSYDYTIDFMSNGGIIRQQVNSENIFQNQNAYGHQARGKLSYYLAHWKLSAFGDFCYFKASEVEINSDEEIIRTIGTPAIEVNKLTGKSSTKRKSYSIALEVSFNF